MTTNTANTVKNFSRHPFNKDQKAALESIGFSVEDGCRSPFFRDAADLVDQTNGVVASVVAPMGMLLEALAKSHIDNWSSIVIDWTADESARKRGRFAVRQMRVFQISDGKVEMIDWGTRTIMPTVENDFRTGEEFFYDVERRFQNDNQPVA